MSKLPNQSRRRFLKGASLLSASGILAATASVASTGAKNRQAKNIIFLVADGLGSGSLALAHHWRLKNEKKPLEWMQLLGRSDVTLAFQDTASANSPVTDSAAAGSAWGGGHRVNNGAINIDATGSAHEPILKKAKQVGKRIGLVSTCRITHATSASFLANVLSRDSENEIARQYIERDLDICLGGGLQKFSNSEQNLLPKFQKKGYAICTKIEELLKIKHPQDKILGLFTESHFPYAIDRLANEGSSNLPSLELMFQTAVDSLANHPDGFFLQVEAGRVDHAGHDNDPAAILHETLEFDRCVRTALDFCENNTDTLLIVTTDHGTGGGQLDGIGHRYLGSNDALKNINNFKTSFELIGQQALNKGKLDPKFFKEMTGITLPNAKVEAFNAKLKKGISYMSAALTDHFIDEIKPTTGVGWTSHNHTAENVELLALGPGADLIPKFIKNYELHNIMCEALEI
jgi:alkaline phosphatase